MEGLALRPSSRAGTPGSPQASHAAKFGHLSFLSGSNFCPSRPLSGGYSLASGSGNRPLFAACNSSFASTHEDVPKGGQGGGYAVQFILKSCAFLLEFANYRLHQCFWHEVILSLHLVHKMILVEDSFPKTRLGCL